jgi:hypothetical protein
MKNIVDELGIVNVRIAELEATARKLKAELIARGIGKYEGTQYFAEVLEYDRENISAPLVRQLADSEFIRKVTTSQHIKSVVVKSCLT